MSKDFELFQREFKRWQERFGLAGYTVYFKHEPIEDYFADIEVNQDNMVATTRLNSNVPKNWNPHKDIRRSAKHEAIHLLVSRLEKNARYRYVSETEIYECTEELVHKLENLIS